VLPGPEAADETPRLRRVTWPKAYRLIASRFPPIHLFERVSADPRDWEVLIAAEMLVNPRVRDEIGEIRLVPAEDRVTGPGAGWVMAAFTHRNPRGSRFSEGTYGIWYAANTLATAIRESAHGFARFAHDSDDGPRSEDMRVLASGIDADFHDIVTLPPAARARVLDPDDWGAGRLLGGRLREAGSNGVVYPSVRDPAGTCIAAFRPKAIQAPLQERHVRFHWDGTRVARWFDYAEEAWTSL
jgi:RES domain-containing protein